MFFYMHYDLRYTYFIYYILLYTIHYNVKCKLLRMHINKY